VLVRGASPAERRILIEAQRLGRRVATYLDDDLERVPASDAQRLLLHPKVVPTVISSRARDVGAGVRQRLGAELAARYGVRDPRRQPRPAPELGPARARARDRSRGSSRQRRPRGFLEGASVSRCARCADGAAELCSAARFRAHALSAECHEFG
jgi:hypothetical protein